MMPVMKHQNNNGEKSVQDPPQPQPQRQEPSVKVVLEERPVQVKKEGGFFLTKTKSGASSPTMSLTKMLQQSAAATATATADSGPFGPFAPATSTTTAVPSGKTATGSTVPTTSTTTTTTTTAPVPAKVQEWVDDLQKWFIVQGCSVNGGVQAFLTAYYQKLLDLEIPVDMIFGGGVLLSEYTPGYIWTCETTKEQQETNDKKCQEMEISRAQFEVYQAQLPPEDPFVILRERRATFVRLRKGIHKIPTQSCPWYHDKHMTDYFALPIFHNNVFLGGFAWVTRHTDGFSPNVLQCLQHSMPSFSAVMRLHTNDTVMESLTVRVEEEIHQRTLELQKNNQLLWEANQRVRQQAAAQLEHFACMSHEVRTPLNCIIGLSHLMLQESEENNNGGETLTPSQRDSLQLITTSGDLLRHVVDDVLDYTKLAAGHLEIQMAPMNLQDLMQQSIRAFDREVQLHQLTFRLFVGPHVPAMIQSDHRRWSQILYNLLGNAVKFSPDGSPIDITLSLISSSSMSNNNNSNPKTNNAQDNNNNNNNNNSVSLEKEDKASCEKQQQEQQEQRHVLKLTIKDYGKGIAPEDLETIFQPFHQTESSTSDSTYGGMGLGLSIASKIVQGLGGTISVDSALGQWCQFTVELPYHGVVANDNHTTTTISPHRFQTNADNNIVILLMIPDLQECRRLVDDVFTPHGIPVHVLQSWSDKNNHNSDDLDKLLLLRHNSTATAISKKTYYICLCDHSLYDAARFETLATQTAAAAETAGKVEETSVMKIVTFGSSRDKIHGPTDAHYESSSLSFVFPSVLIQNLYQVIFAETSDNNNNNNTVSKIISPSSSSSKPSRPNETEMVVPPFPAADHNGQSSNNNVTPTTTTPPPPSIITPPQSCSGTAAPKPPTVSSTSTTAATASSSSSSSSKYACLKVLITEDNRINQKVLHKALSRLGLQNVDIVDNGAKAVALTAEKPFDLIFMDIQMPVMDGLEATRLITARRRENGTNGRVDPTTTTTRTTIQKQTTETTTTTTTTTKNKPTVIFLSAHATENYKKKALAVGGDGFIAKPFQLPKLEEALQSALVEG